MPTPCLSQTPLPLGKCLECVSARVTVELCLVSPAILERERNVDFTQPRKINFRSSYCAVYGSFPPRPAKLPGSPPPERAPDKIKEMSQIPSTHISCLLPTCGVDTQPSLSQSLSPDSSLFQEPVRHGPLRRGSLRRGWLRGPLRRGFPRTLDCSE